MDFLHIIARRIRANVRPLVARRRAESDLDEEIRFHVDAEVEARVRRGMSPDDALTSTLRDFGGVARYKDECRDAWSTRVVDELGRDVRYAARTLRRSPTFTLVAVLTVALGVGAATTVFSVVQSVLRALPYDEPNELVAVRTVFRGADDATSALDFLDWRRQSTAFADLAAISADPMNITGGGDPERLFAATVSANLFSLLRVQPLVGQLMRPGDDAGAGRRVVLLSEALWRRRFGADSGVVGRAVTLDGAPYTVLGVVPRRTAYPAGADIYVPLVFPVDDLDEGNRGARYYLVVGRLTRGTTLEAATAEMRAIAARLAAAHPADADATVRVTPLLDELVGTFRRPLLVLMAAAGVLLLIACANVANLLLVRSAGRDGEMAVRTALGAARGRLARQLTTEAIVPFLVGGALGAVFATLGTRLFVRFAGDSVPRLAELGIDGRALGFAVGTTLVTGVLFGVVPALRFTRVNLAGSLRTLGRGARGSIARRRARTLIVGGEVALAVVLLAGAGLVVRSFGELMAVDPGFRRDGVITFRLELPRSTYDTPAKLRAFVAALDPRVRELPGVTSHAVVIRPPLSTFNFNVGFSVEGRPPTPAGQRPAVQVRVASAGYFETMGIRVAAGRTFTPRDDERSPQVVVINRAMARKHFGGEEPIGKRIWLGWEEDGVPRGGEIIGVIDDVHQFQLARRPEPEMYLAYAQTPVHQLTVVARTSSTPDAVLAAARGAVAAVDRDLPIFELGTLERRFQESAARPRLYMSLLTAFALVALALAAIGLYGVMAYAVRQQTHELGVRIALGASRAEVVRLVVGSSLRVTLGGAALGIAAALGLSSLVRSLLFGVSASDPWTYAAVAVLITAVGVAASWIPARRATAIDPVTALRADG
jgi:putative ABC transport system permease protein